MKWFIVVLIFVGVLFLECGYGNNSLPPDLFYFLPGQQPQNKDLYEDFDGKLDLNWNVLGLDLKHMSLDKVPGSLTLTTQSGSFEFSNTDYKNIFLVDFPADQSVDFQLTTCISNFKPSEIWNQAGLLLWNDKDNFFKLAYEYGEETGQGNGPLFSAGRETSGTPYYTWFIIEQIPQKMWLRVIKKGNVYVLYNSTDGKNFNPMKIYRSHNSTIKDNTIPILDVPIKSIGIFTSNYTSRTAPEVNASFDFFEFKVLSTETKLPDYPII